ncbi:MAG: N-acetylmuramoyl-L-alanine amidase family protein [Bacillota bacterium]
MKKAVLNAWPSVTVSEGNGWHSRLTLELTGLPERIEFADLTCNTDTDRGAGLGQADCDAGERPPQGTLHDIDRQIPKHEQAEFETCPGVILQDTYRYRFILYGVDLVMAADDIVVADGLVRMVRIRSSRGRAQDKPVAIQANRYTGQVAQADTLVESNPQVSPQVQLDMFSASSAGKPTRPDTRPDRNAVHIDVFLEYPLGEQFHKAPLYGPTRDVGEGEQSRKAREREQPCEVPAGEQPGKVPVGVQSHEAPGDEQSHKAPVDMPLNHPRLKPAEEEQPHKFSMDIRQTPGLPATVTFSFSREPLQRLFTGVRIGIDPGHGGKDKGIQGPVDLTEKYVSLEIARELGRLLDLSGAYPVMTRTEDVYLTEEQRMRLLRGENPALCVQIHAAGSHDPLAQVYRVAAKQGCSDSRLLAEEVALALLERMGIAPEQGVFSVGPGLNVPNVPFVRVEPLCLTYFADEANFRAPLFRKRLAQSMYNGIARYLYKTKGNHSRNTMGNRAGTMRNGERTGGEQHPSHGKTTEKSIRRRKRLR